METATINTKGQLTIPSTIRRKLNLSSGDTVKLYLEEDGSLAVVPVTKSLRELSGILKRPSRAPLSIEEMTLSAQQAAAKHVMSRDRN